MIRPGSQGWGVGAVRKGLLSAVAAAIALASCAGRDAQPVATVQPQDAMSDCAMISAEIQANNIKIKELADEKGMKVAQNVAAGVAGLVIWPIWFGMDFKGAADKDLVALQSRQEYLTQLAAARCTSAAPPPPPPAVSSPPPRRVAAKPKPKPAAAPMPAAPATQPAAPSQ
jgi:hypothetical protein